MKIQPRIAMKAAITRLDAVLQAKVERGGTLVAPHNNLAVWRTQLRITTVRSTQNIQRTLIMCEATRRSRRTEERENMRTFEILEAGNRFATLRARSPESAIRAARRQTTISASDYNCSRGDIVELEWTARALDDAPGGVATLTFTARAR